MITFMELPLWGRSILLVGMFFLLIAQATGIYLMGRGRKQRKKISLMIQTTVTMILLSILAEGNIEEFMKQKMERSVIYGMKIPIILLFLYEGLLGIYILKTIIKEKKEQRLEINKGTIKESADTLPMGICFARLNGHPYLVNEKMNELSYKLRGRILQNEESFWNDLVKEKFLYDAKTPIIRFDDGTIWVFRKRILKIYEHQVIQLTATDSTQLYKLYEELQIKNKELTIMNQKLQEYEEQVEGLTKAQERLALKIRIHDAIGQNLIATKYFLLQGHEKNDVSQILNQWKRSVAMLYQEVEEEQTNVLQYLMSAAKSAGVKIILQGEIPESTKIQEMIVAAGAEALTNAVRHAKADILWIEIKETSYEYIIDFRNEKNQCHQVSEGGGLSSLRKRIEDRKGSMEIFTDEDFILRIRLPKLPKIERGEFL